MRLRAKSVAVAIGDLIVQGGLGLLVMVVAIAVHLQPAVLLQSRGSVLLAAAFVMGLLTVAIHRFGDGLKFFPRQLRLRIELEDALFALQVITRAGGDPAAVAERLGRIRRLARTGPWRARIVAWQERLQRNEPQESASVSSELGAALREFATNAGSRMPLAHPAMLPGDVILRVSGEMAVYCALLGIVSPDVPLISVVTVLGGLTIFSTALAALRFVRITSCKAHDIRSKARFRTIVVTDKRELSRLGAIAVTHLYAQIGHVVVICGEGEREGGHVPDAPGIYFLLGDIGTLTAALAAFAPHADLIVLDTLDEATARQVHADTALPPCRYLALSDDGSAPPCYRWIDLRTLLILPSDRRARTTVGDSYLWGNRRRRLPFVELYFFVCTASALLFLRLDHGVPLALFFLISALGRVLPELFGPRRLGAICRATLRLPKAPEISRALDPRRLEWRLWIATSLWWAASVAYFALRTGFHPDRKLDPTILTIFVAFYLLLFGGRSIVSSLLIVRKWSLDWNFRIVALRRNARKFGYGHKTFVLATCGKYGRVVVLYDYELDRTDDDYGEWRESSMGDWFATFSQIQQTLKPNNFLHSWQRQVLIELQVADFAVFDWIEEVTDHMRWELEHALGLLPARRVLIVCAPENSEGVTCFLDSRLAEGADRPLILIASRERDDQYIWGDHRAFDAAFKATLHDALTALTAEPRPAHGRLQEGAWAFPCPADEAAQTR